MTKQEREFWLRVQRRVNGLTPEIASAILRGFVYLRKVMPERELAFIVSRGDIDTLIHVVLGERVLDAAFAPVRQAVQGSIVSNARYLVRDIPINKAAQQTVGLGFNMLNPRIIDAVRILDTRVMQTLKNDVRETVRAFVENGLRDGASPRSVARDIRQVVGLGPNQEKAVSNFRKMLETGDREALKRLLRDKRFDRTLLKALGKDGTGLSSEQIVKMTEAYRKRMIAFNAETNARTAALQSMQLGQRLSMEEAIANGALDRSRLMKRWVGVMDSRERPSHRVMEGQTVPFDQPFSNGQMIPGEEEYNCRCLARHFLA